MIDQGGIPTSTVGSVSLHLPAPCSRSMSVYVLQASVRVLSHNIGCCITVKSMYNYERQITSFHVVLSGPSDLKGIFVSHHISIFGNPI